MSFKIFRRGSARCIGLLSAFVTVLLCLYYISVGQSSSLANNDSSGAASGGNINGVLPPAAAQKDVRVKSWLSNELDPENPSELKNAIEDDPDVVHGVVSSNPVDPKWLTCSALTDAVTNITTLDEYSRFDFQPEWMKTKEYWDKTFETKFDELQKDPKRPPLKVIIVPHSHNDPGWLKTFVNYFQSDSRQILNLMITKMQEYKDMTFIWSEISILQLWWDQAHPTKQRALKKLVQSGRLEITTGGWVMTDEANAHLYSMVDQLIEGHQWVKTNLNVTPSSGWSIDPFGHGSTVPYLLSASGFKGTIIQRIHYAWKQWFAKHQQGDFMWSPHWATSNSHKYSMLTHNMPFDIYSIKHSCGPHPFICLNFDFRKIPGEYTEYSVKAQFITDDNVEAKADLLMEQYARTASLFQHNVALIPVGDDFRYNKEKEVEQQYVNYKKLIDFINKNKDRYKNAEVHFGTPSKYFEAIKERSHQFPSLKGDFFVYSDIFTEGRPAYWSGYFTTRPMYKILTRELEHNLRAVEILFTVAFNVARQTSNTNALRVFEKNYEKMILARRNLGLFQHHDAITGTSKAAVMRDYGIRLFESIQDTVKLQESAIELLTQKSSNKHNFVLSELERESFNKVPRKTATAVTVDLGKEFIVYNSLAQESLQVILIRTLSPHVKVLDASNNELEIQVNPVWNITENYEAIGLGYSSKIKVSEKQFEILFVSRLSPLSLTRFKVVHSEPTVSKLRTATLYCADCKENNSSSFEIRNKQPGDIQLENFKMRLLFDEKSGFLKTVTKKSAGKPIQCAIKFAAYRSAQFHSGAYLFKTDQEAKDSEKDVLEQYGDVRLLITSGPIASDVTAIYGPFLAHTVRIFNTKTELDQAIYIENDNDFEPPPKNRETELFMRLVTDIENGETPEFYSDLNGFQYEKRVKVNAIGIEGNYFPITSAAFMQDEKLRLTLITSHAQGAASLEPGQIEVMMDRRTLYDDYRGMGEGVVDSKLTRHQHWLTLENFNAKSLDKSSASYKTPSQFANNLINSLNYPANIYFVENQDESSAMALQDKVLLLGEDVSLPCDVHLLTLRTQTENEMPLFPSKHALLVLQRQGNDCAMPVDEEYGDMLKNCGERGLPNRLFNDIEVGSVHRTTLTALQTLEPVVRWSDVYLEPMEMQTFNLTFV